MLREGKSTLVFPNHPNFNELQDSTGEDVGAPGNKRHLFPAAASGFLGARE